MRISNKLYLNSGRWMHSIHSYLLKHNCMHTHDRTISLQQKKAPNVLDSGRTSTQHDA